MKKCSQFCVCKISAIDRLIKLDYVFMLLKGNSIFIVVAYLSCPRVNNRSAEGQVWRETMTNPSAGVWQC